MIIATKKQGRQAVANRPHLSASQLRTFATCSLEWLLSRHNKPEFVSSSLRFGGAVHEALGAYYQARLEGRECSQAEMLAAYEKAWADETGRDVGVSVKYPEGESRDTLRELASRMFAAFLAGVRPSRVIAVEEPFEVPLAQGLPPLVGYIDLVEIRDDDDGERLWLVDHKTAGKRPSQSGMDPDQVILYGLGLARNGTLKELGLPLGVRYDVLTKLKKPELISVEMQPTRRDAERLIEKARRIWRAMEAEAVWPNPGWWCQGCGHQALCDRWPAA